MGIDYSADFGIGYEVTEGDEIADTEEMEDGIAEYLSYAELSDGFSYFETNDGYDTPTDGVYLVIDDPLKDGLDLTKAKERLDKELARLKLDPVGEFGPVGGMYVY